MTVLLDILRDTPTRAVDEQLPAAIWPAGSNATNISDDAAAHAIQAIVIWTDCTAW